MAVNTLTPDCKPYVVRTRPASHVFFPHAKPVSCALGCLALNPTSKHLHRRPLLSQSPSDALHLKDIQAVMPVLNQRDALLTVTCRCPADQLAKPCLTLHQPAFSYLAATLPAANKCIPDQRTPTVLLPLSGRSYLYDFFQSLHVATAHTAR